MEQMRLVTGDEGALYQHTARIAMRSAYTPAPHVLARLTLIL